MKKLIVTTLVIFGIAVYGMALAQGFGPGNKQEVPGNGNQELSRPDQNDSHGNRDQRRPPKGHGLFDKVLHDNVMTEALVELTGKTAEAIAAELEGKDMREFLEESGIEKDALKAKMDEKTADMVEKLSGCGVITQDQAAGILEKLAERNTPKEEGL